MIEPVTSAAPCRVGIGEVLGGLGDEGVDLVGLELDPVILGERAVRQIGDVDAHRLRRIGRGAVVVAADRRCSRCRA